MQPIEDITKQIEDVIEEIIANLKLSYPERYEEVARSVLVDKDIGACQDIKVLELLKKLEFLEAQTVTPTMKLVQKSQDNIRDGERFQQTFDEFTKGLEG